MNSIGYKTALGGVISALCLMLMFTTSLSPVFYLVMPMLAGMLILMVRFETDTRWSLTAYASVGILSMLITFNKESVMMFILFFGYYPVIREYIEKISSAFVKYILKLIIYNTATISEMVIAIYIFGITDMLNEMGDMGKYGMLVMLIMSNIMFAVYDIALSNCELIYKNWFRTKILCKN